MKFAHPYALFPRRSILLLLLALLFPSHYSEDHVLAAVRSTEPTSIPDARASNPPPDSNRLIVKLNPFGSDESISLLMDEMNANVIHELESIEAEVWAVDEGDIETIIAHYQDDPRIAFIEQDAIITLELPDGEGIQSVPHNEISANASPVSGFSFPVNDFYYGSQWALHNIGQTGGMNDADIDAPETWQILSGSRVVVGVIDSGVDYKHEDLAANLWTNPNEIPNNGIDDDTNGYIDDIHGWDFSANDNDPMDENGHGTHVAGTIAAVGNNGRGIAGVSWNTEIMALRFIGPEGWGYLSDAIAAIEYATMMDATLTNNSWGGVSYYQSLYDAVAAADQAGILFVVASGNAASDNDAAPSYPASYDLDNIISVASTTSNDKLSSFSSYGHSSVDLGAPGSTILSTYPGGYAYMSGTSMASPHVAGAAALLWSAYPNESAAQIKARILNATDPLADLAEKTLTEGRLNLYGAFLYQSPAPIIQLEQTMLDVELSAGEQITTSVFITNTGDAALSWHTSITYTTDGATGESEYDWLTLTPTTSVLLTDTVMPLDVLINAADLADGLYHASVALFSSEPNFSESTIEISVTIATPDYPVLSIPSLIEASYWPGGVAPFSYGDGQPTNQIEVPLRLESNDYSLASVIFSLDFDESCLEFDDRDRDGDGIPDSVSFDVPDTHVVSVLYDPQDTTGELDFAVMDIDSPVSALPDGIFGRLRFGLTCEPSITETAISPIVFASDIMPSFRSLSDQIIPGITSGGQITVHLGQWRGDCNNDRSIGAADVSAIISELFDGDGNEWLSVGGGTFAGSIAGCDANGDEKIDAGDLICTVLLVFDNLATCRADDNLTRALDESAALLTIGKPYVDEDARTVAFPLDLESSNGTAGALSLSLAFNPYLFRFVPTDADESGYPDSITTPLGDEHVVSILYNELASQLDILIADLTPQFGAELSFTPISDGNLLVIPLHIQDGFEKENETLADAIGRHFANPTPPFGFAADLPPSIGTLHGQSGPLRTNSRAATTGSQTAEIPPSPVQPVFPIAPENNALVDDERNSGEPEHNIGDGPTEDEITERPESTPKVFVPLISH